MFGLSFPELVLSGVLLFWGFTFYNVVYCSCAKYWGGEVSSRDRDRRDVCLLIVPLSVFLALMGNYCLELPPQSNRDGLYYVEKRLKFREERQRFRTMTPEQRAFELYSRGKIEKYTEVVIQKDCSDGTEMELERDKHD